MTDDEQFWVKNSFGDAAWGRIAQWSSEESPPTWHSLSCTEDIPWTKELLARFAGFLDWEQLSTNLGLPWGEDLLDVYSDRWRLNALDTLISLPWKPDHVPTMTANWNCSLDDLRCEVAHRLLSCEQEADLGILWTCISMEGEIEWSAELVRRHARELCAPALCQNSSLPWSEQFISECEEVWYWPELLGSQHVTWTFALVRRAARS